MCAGLVGHSEDYRHRTGTVGFFSALESRANFNIVGPETISIDHNSVSDQNMMIRQEEIILIFELPGNGILLPFFRTYI